jgi:hypothetical protein
MAQQMNSTFRGNRIKGVIAACTPYKFLWYAGDPGKYPGLQSGNTINMAVACGGLVEKRGSHTEKGLFGRAGGYITRLSKNTAGEPCPFYRIIIKKEANMGGSIYYCATCQVL